MNEICEPKKARQNLFFSMHEEPYLATTLCDTEQLLDQRRLQGVLQLKQP